MSRREDAVTAELDTRKVMLNGRKTERIIFAVTPELKKTIAKDQDRKPVALFGTTHARGA